MVGEKDGVSSTADPRFYFWWVPCAICYDGQVKQETALSILKSGANVFLTGEPGSGKTHTVNTYISYLREHDIEPAITASTGIAATHIGGMTIHSWSGIGVSQSLSPYELESLLERKPLVERVRATQVLIIDEVSMLDARIITLVDTVLRHIRRSPEAFGGMQVVFVGDFFQLPPVTRGGDTARFACEADVWGEAGPVVCYLSEQYRQEDEVFLQVLSALRRGDVTNEVHEQLAARAHDEGAPHPDAVTKLYTHNVDVDRINEEKLAEIDGVSKSFHMAGHGAKNLVEHLKRGCLSPEDLNLKISAAVMFTKNNFDAGYVNGTLGTVIGFADDGDWPVVETRNGERITAIPAEWVIEDGKAVLARIIQVPLRLAWAITVHKSQGMSLDAALVDLSKAFEYGQGYVALSRVRSFSGLYLLGYNPRALQVHPSIARHDTHFLEESRGAEKVFGELEKEELHAMHVNFITAAGGTLEKKEKSEKKKDKTQRKSGINTYDQTRALLLEGKRVRDIAQARELSEQTIWGHIEKLKQERRISTKDIAHIAPGISDDEMRRIHDVFRSLETTKLTPVFEYFNEKYSFDTLRATRLFLNK